jgi:hypothetical protein
MFEDLSFWSVLTVARSVLLLVGICAVAAWAARQPDQETAFLKRLTQRKSSRCTDGAQVDGGSTGT